MAAEATLAAMSAELARLRAENERLRAASASSLPGGAAASSSLAVAIPDAASAAEVARLKAEVQELKAQLDSLRSIPRPLPMLTPGPADAASTFGGSAGLDPIYGAWGPPPRPQYGQMRIWVGSWNMGAADPFATMDFVHEAPRLNAMLSPFIPGPGSGFDVFVLGVQEGVSDRVFEAVAAYTGAYRLPLHRKLYPAKELPKGGAGGTAGTRVRSRRMGRAIAVQQLIDDAVAGHELEPVASMADMMDRVWGRGDGAILSPKFTGVGVFVSRAVAPHCRLLGVYKHSFGASEGSKGGVGVALKLFDVTAAFVNVHMASKKTELRRAQYCELVDRLGAKLGGRGFGLNEEFHHVVWMGDTNYHVKDVSAAEALALISTGQHLRLLENRDELLEDKANELAFHDYIEPPMAPDFYPTYKKRTDRGATDMSDPTWPRKVYLTAFKEVFYKGGRTVDRIPSWTDRIQYHSLPDKLGQLLPEPLDPARPDDGPSNYRAVNDAPAGGLDCSDHSPVFCTFTLAVTHDGVVDERLAREVERLQGQMGYRHPDADDDEGGDAATTGGSTGGPAGDDGAGAAATGRPLSLPLATPGRAPGLASLASPGGRTGAAAGAAGAASVTGSALGAHLGAGAVSAADFSALHPSQRPLELILSVRNILVEYRGQMRSPRAVSVLFPLPYEDSDGIPDRQKVIKSGALFSFTGAAPSESREGMAVSIPVIVSRASLLEGLHLLIKVSMDDNTKAQCVVCMRDGGFVSAGTHVNTFLQPLYANGLPLRDSADRSRTAAVQFELLMNAYERGGSSAGPHHNIMAGGRPMPGLGPAGVAAGGGGGGGSARSLLSPGGAAAATGRSAYNPYAHHAPALPVAAAAGHGGYGPGPDGHGAPGSARSAGGRPRGVTAPAVGAAHAHGFGHGHGHGPYSGPAAHGHGHGHGAHGAHGAHGPHGHPHGPYGGPGPAYYGHEADEEFHVASPLHGHGHGHGHGPAYGHGAAGLGAGAAPVRRGGSPRAGAAPPPVPGRAGPASGSGHSSSPSAGGGLRYPAGAGPSSVGAGASPSAADAKARAAALIAARAAAGNPGGSTPTRAVLTLPDHAGLSAPGSAAAAAAAAGMGPAGFDSFAKSHLRRGSAPHGHGPAGAGGAAPRGTHAAAGYGSSGSDGEYGGPGVSGLSVGMGIGPYVRPLTDDALGEVSTAATIRAPAPAPAAPQAPSVVEGASSGSAGSLGEHHA